MPKGKAGSWEADQKRFEVAGTADWAAPAAGGRRGNLPRLRRSSSRTSTPSRSDYVARQKVQGQHVNFYIVEQLPFVLPGAYARRFGSKTAEQIIRDDVLRLTYVSHDMEAFARDQGHEGPPFAWDEEDRLRRRARLDALFFHLYGLDRDDAAYVLGTFPIVEREERERWGRFRSRDLILAYMAALAAGNPDAPVAG